MQERVLQLFRPQFDSRLLSLILELEHLRKKQIDLSTHPMVFQQLKRLFHILESVGSARIEGNNTTLAEYLEQQEEQEEALNLQEENYKEIKNIELALQFIEECGTERPIDRFFLSQLHQLVVKDLSAKREGDNRAGQYRVSNVRIAGSSHTPPDHLLVNDMMDDLLHFIRRDDLPQFDLIKMAQAHHRFVWIHPFGNGNGRTVRLFTYAMLLRAGFKVDIAGRIVNPTAIFCSDRDEYYHHLGLADQGTYEGMEAWCVYVLSGLLEEIKKIDRLSDYEYLRETILLPALSDAQSNGRLSLDDYRALCIVARKQVAMSGDLREAFSRGLSTANLSRKAQALLQARLLMPEKTGGRKYVLSLANPYLMPSITKRLAQEGFLPSNL